MVTPLSGGTPSLAPDHQLLLLRVTMEPGVAIPPHSHPGPVALHVESGLFGTEFFEGSGTVQPAPQNGTPVLAIEMAPGDDIQMPAGDHLFYDGAVHTMRNDGDDQLVLLVAALFDPTLPRRRAHLAGAYQFTQRSVQDGRWDLIVNTRKPDYPDIRGARGADAVQLFNLDADPWEQVNLAWDARLAEIRTRLENALLDWQYEVGEPVLATSVS